MNRCLIIYWRNNLVVYLNVSKPAPAMTPLVALGRRPFLQDPQPPCQRIAFSSSEWQLSRLSIGQSDTIKTKEHQCKLSVINSWFQIVCHFKWYNHPARPPFHKYIEFFFLRDKNGPLGHAAHISHCLSGSRLVMEAKDWWTLFLSGKKSRRCKKSDIQLPTTTQGLVLKIV